jgi:UDP-N-acetylglucosamine--N-acetylmuramyl-(pentapeptide) pyrophosphoryl-undecaprenol N-acetylglucosamine transferase
MPHAARGPPDGLKLTVLGRASVSSTALSLAEDVRESPRKLLLVASTGGHLWQLARLAPRLGASEDSLWMTFDSPQSRSLLEERRTTFLPYVAPRDWKGAAHAERIMRNCARHEDFDGVVSTGAAIAVSAMVAAQRAVPARLYIESVSRFDGPSLTGSIIERCHLARTLTQHRGWSTGRWEYEGSVLEDYALEPRPPRPVRRMFVTLGTIRPFGFRRLLDRLAAITPPEVEVIWQVGETDGSRLPGDVHRYMDNTAFEAAVQAADVVVTHAGIGTLLGLLEDGVQPVAVPREARYREHVDDHQAQAARALSELGLVVNRRVHELTWADLEGSSRMRVVRRP